MKLINSPLVSIIIPVYNASNSVSISLESIYMQSYNNIELVIVDDCSKDNSLAIIEQYRQRFMNKGIVMKLLKHEVNNGVATARNTALDNATGDYIYCVDADDAINSDAIERMVHEANVSHADIVGINWFLSSGGNNRIMTQPTYSSSLEAIELMLRGQMKWNLWLFMVKRSLYELNNIRFLPGMNMGEDLMVTIKLFASSKKVTSLSKPLYYYSRDNSNSLTTVYSDDHIKEVSMNVKEVESFLIRKNLFENTRELLMFLKLNVKFPLLISEKKEQYIKWKNLFVESNTYIFRNKSISLRNKLVQWLALCDMFILLKVHYYLIFKFMYRIIYK